jgi:hypothetical protein
MSIDRRRHSSVRDIRFYSGVDSGNDNYMVAAKVRERL